VQFESLYIAHKTDDSFLGALKSQETKQLKGLENLKNEAQKKKILFKPETVVHRINFAGTQTNFSEFYLE
jgi:hypothetical protein